MDKQELKKTLAQLTIDLILASQQEAYAKEKVSELEASMKECHISMIMSYETYLDGWNFHLKELKEKQIEILKQSNDIKMALDIIKNGSH